MTTADSLRAYRAKRAFKRPAEPAGGERGAGEEPIFVIQKHDASTLHYDFRLEVGGVLKSWAVPKGPSTDPSVKRLAMPTEDHPLEYADFEGVIPEDEYGGGTVIVWDTGTYRNLQAEKEAPVSMAQALQDGHVEVWLEGRKLRGGYALIRTDFRGEESWLLVKMKDEAAEEGRDVTQDEPDSALSGRSLDEVAEEGA